MIDLLPIALGYHDRGLAIVPIGSGTKAPIVTDWQTKKLARDDIQYWFTNGHNVTGIGIITGQLSGNVVNLDFDGEHWRTAFETFWEDWRDRLAFAPLVETGSGKRHLWVKIPDLPTTFTVQKFGRDRFIDKGGRPSCHQIIELRGNASNNLLPPSLHPCGERYRWLTSDADIIEIPFKEMHSWLKNWEEPDTTPPKQLPLHNPAPVALPRRTLEFLANGAPEGQRNTETYYAAQQFAAAGVPLETALGKLKPVGLAIGLAETEIEATVKSGFTGALKAGFAPYTPPQETAKKPTPTQDVLRDRWLAGAGLICYGLGEFRRYHSGLWPPLPGVTVKREIMQVCEAAIKEGIKPSAGLVASVTELAKYKIALGDDSIFDSQADYLVCANGTLSIATRALGAHKPELYATSGVLFDFDPVAKYPAWLAFLTDLGLATSQEVIGFLQEFAGYALTTDTKHELSVWLFGPPGSGKSTFLAGLEAMLGSRVGLLGLADIERNRFALANLPGKTLAIATEQPGDYIASTHILNALISGETITVDRKFRDAIEVTPRCKLAWAMNELPRVSDPNSGIFRRVKVVTFPAIPEAQKDPALKEAIKTEGAGILNWALDGLARLRTRGGFEIPQAVKEATQSFKDGNDIPARFVEEVCKIGDDPTTGQPYRVQTGDLYNAYRGWCDRNGHKPKSSTAIAEDWRRMGFSKYRPGGVVYWQWVGLIV